MEKNHLIIEKLSQLYEIYRRDPEYKFKAKALSTSLPLLNSYQQPILHGKQAMKEIKGVGKGIAERIDEILATGSLAELEEHTERIRKYAVIEELKSITGVGDVRAEEWYSMGLRTVADVRRAVAEEQIAITHHIQLGLLYYDDIRERIPRAEMERLEERIAGYVREVNGGLIYQICGSYRRGNATSGDIDIIISHPDYMENIAKQRFLPKIVKRMSDDGFLVGHLTEKGDKKYMGLCILSRGGKARRIDIRVFDYISYYAGVLYFTGSQHFNIEIRQRAIERGMSLNEYGLTNSATKEKIFLRSEEELFTLLDLPYRTPTQRNV